MAEYRTPLPAMLAGFLEAAINRVLAMDPSSVAQIERLERKVLQLDLDGLAITLFFTFEYGSVRVALETESRPDTVIRGSPVALFAMAGPDEIRDWDLPGSGVNIEGDAALARDLGHLFNSLEPDWESQIATLLGDVLGFQVTSGLRRGAESMRQAAKTTMDTTADYLRGDGGALITQAELDEFLDAVDTLRDGIDRLEARLEKMDESGS